MLAPEMTASAKLARRSALRPVQVVAVTGGKGGVGKTTVAVNLATGLAALGRRTMLLDGDLGLANVDILLGLTPRFTLADVVAGTRSLDEVVIDTKLGFQVVPGGSGIADLASLSDAEHYGLIRAFSAIAPGLDTLIVDTAAGISPSVLQLSQACQSVLVVVCDEPASVADAYALVKVLSRKHGVGRFQILASMVRAKGAGKRLFDTLTRVTGQFLDVTLTYAGEIPDDPYLRRSVLEQRPVLAAYPSSPAARAFKFLAALVDNWELPTGARGNLEFFAERLVHRPQPKMEVVR
jgi:flagellar biosynthesis protein FlhG